MRRPPDRGCCRSWPFGGPGTDSHGGLSCEFSGCGRFGGSGMVDLDHLGLLPAAWWPAPALRMPAVSLLVGLLTDGADRIGLAVVTLIGRHILDAAVAMLAVVPLHKAINPGSYRNQIPEAPQRIALVILTAPRDCSTWCETMIQRRHCHCSPAAWRRRVISRVPPFWPPA
jgi:hypothetical protein